MIRKSDGNVAAGRVLCQMTLMLEDSTEAENVSAPMVWLAVRGDQYFIATSSCLNSKDLKFYGAVNGYRKWHTNRIMRSPTGLIEQFLIFQVVLRKKAEALGLGTPSSNGSGRFRVSPVQMRISPSVIMRQAVSHEVQALFQAKMMRFLLVHDGMLHNCIVN